VEIFTHVKVTLTT